MPARGHAARPPLPGGPAGASSDPKRTPTGEPMALNCRTFAGPAGVNGSPRTAASAGSPPPRTVIERRAGWQVVDLAELWAYRDLLFFLTWRDVKVRYKQTALGVAWAILQPLATMMVFGLFFGRMAGRGASDLPYPLFVLSGLVPWMFFANAINSAAQSVVGSQGLVTKVYFPRLIIPMGAVGAGLVDFAIAFALLLPVMPACGRPFGWGLLLLPVPTLGLAVTALGVGSLLAALTVAYRDFRYVLPFLVQVWMFATPGIYMQDGDAVGPILGGLLPLNPVHGLIVNFRSALSGGGIDPGSLSVSGAVGLASLAVGCLYFRRVERGFSDII